MNLKMFQVDAFAEKVFEGNPAAVCPLDQWLTDRLLQAIAVENNLSETAFFVRNGAQFDLRWFTPTAEVDLCGHATLAAAHVLYQHLGYTGAAIQFKTRSGPLTVTRSADSLCMDFPAAPPRAVTAPDPLVTGLGKRPTAVLAAYDYVVVYDSEAEILRLSPDFRILQTLDRRGVVATAPGTQADFVSRCFFPNLGVDEDPVTGSAYCELTPYWHSRLGRRRLIARQLSKRRGSIACELKQDRVLLSGRAKDYMVAEIFIE